MGGFSRERAKEHRIVSWSEELSCTTMAGQLYCDECGEMIEYGEAYHREVWRITPNSKRYGSHLEIRRHHECCPNKRF